MLVQEVRRDDVTQHPLLRERGDGARARKRVELDANHQPGAADTRHDLGYATRHGLETEPEALALYARAPRRGLAPPLEHVDGADRDG